MVLSQLNKVDRVKTFVNKIPSQPEGYVVSYKGTNLKFVDDDFRQANITVVKIMDKVATFKDFIKVREYIRLKKVIIMLD